MKCFVCNGEMKPYFVKKIEVKYLPGLDTFEYVRCEHCGLTVSKTLYEMSHEEWSEFSYNAHKDYFNGVLKYEVLDPKWLRRIRRIDFQAGLFAELLSLGVFQYGWNTMDYGAGDGKLANEINDRTGVPWLKKFDEYMEPSGEYYLTPEEVREGNFDFIVSSSVFEHLLGNRGEVEKIMELLKPDGIMGLHTLICEEVPQDPEWYYLLPVPVHCTLWTNKAMQIVYQKNGFIGCSYNVEAQMWLFFRNFEAWKKLNEVKHQLHGTWIFSEDFVDYWKCKPYRTKNA